jgi:hypothetical protein
MTTTRVTQILELCDEALDDNDAWRTRFLAGLHDARRAQSVRDHLRAPHGEPGQALVQRLRKAVAERDAAGGTSASTAA